LIEPLGLTILQSLLPRADQRERRQYPRHVLRAWRTLKWLKVKQRSSRVAGLRIGQHTPQAPRRLDARVARGP